jgi:hypothetical protein
MRDQALDTNTMKYTFFCHVPPSPHSRSDRDVLSGNVVEHYSTAACSEASTHIPANVNPFCTVQCPHVRCRAGRACRPLVPTRAGCWWTSSLLSTHSQTVTHIVSSRNHTVLSAVGWTQSAQSHMGHNALWGPDVQIAGVVGSRFQNVDCTLQCMQGPGGPTEGVLGWPLSGAGLSYVFGPPRLPGGDFFAFQRCV